MSIHKLGLAAISLVFLAVVAAGAASQSFNAVAPSREGEPLMKAARTEPRPPEAPRPPGALMTVAGRVVDAAGKPLPGARVAVLADRRMVAGDHDDEPRNIPMGTAAADAEGRFRLEFPAIPARELYHLKLIADAPGRGLGMVGL